MKFISIILIIFVFLLEHKEVKALDFSVDSNESTIYAEGIFEEGDTARLKELIDTINFDSYSIDSTSYKISFNSNG